MSAARYGLMAEFETAEKLLYAARQTRSAGYRRFDAYAPFAVEGLAEAIGFRETRLPFMILLCGVLGGASAYLLQYYVAVIDYPLNVGGRPLHSWPAFILITFEFTVLGAALAAFLGMLVLNRLPQPHHPVFGWDRFEQASQDRFFLCIEADDPQFDLESARRFLDGLWPLAIQEVRHEPS